MENQTEPPSDVSYSRPTRQKVSAALRKAGFSASKSRATRIRGWRDHSAGYDLNQRYDGTIVVRHRLGVIRHNDEEVRRWLNKYELVLAPLGGKIVDDKIVFA